MGVFSRVVRTTVPLGAAAATAYAYKDELAANGIYGMATPFRQLDAFVRTASNSWVNSSSSFDAAFPRGQWHTNWDFRDPKSLLDEKKYANATDEERSKMVKENTPIATRYVILIRHGQYEEEDKKNALTKLGREQATLVGKRLAELHAKRKPIDEVVMSTMTRATETANLILDELPSTVPRKSDSLLEEGAPYPPEPAHEDWKPPAMEFFTEGSRIEAAFRKYIYRASPQQKKDSTEVLVCHGNVIRYFICRGLQFPPEGWLRMSLANSSITVLAIRPSGRVSIKSIGDIGHLPAEKISYSQSSMGVFSRVVRTTVPLGVAAATAYVYKDEIAANGIYGMATPFRQLDAFVRTGSTSWANSTFDSAFPRGQWNPNWDFRDPMSLVNEKKYAKATEEERLQMIKENTPTATRYLILIRHGQYEEEDKIHALTKLGREQATLVGKRLAVLHKKKTPIDEVVMSTMTRATETANLILDELPSTVPRKSDPLLEEGAPYPPEPAIGNWRPHARKFFSDGCRIEAAFRKYFHRASTHQTKDSTQVIVCHANVIRYFICRGLQFPPEGWLRMSLANSSITVLVIQPNGKVSIKSVGDMGHLPAEKISFSQNS